MELRGHSTGKLQLSSYLLVQDKVFKLSIQPQKLLRDITITPGEN